MLGRALLALERACFEPGALPPAAVTAVAIAPAVIAGLVFFQLPALIALALAVALGGSMHALAWRMKQPVGESPALAAVVAVALIGPTTPPLWVLVIALSAGVLELARARLLPGLRVPVGLIVFAVAFFVARPLVATFVNPGTGRVLAEPIRLWAAFGGGAAAPIDPVRLYVGNVPGPIFATSLMAVVIGAAWLWYARRLSLVVLVTFALGAAAPALALRWNVGYHLDSGPAWFAVALLLADRHRLPASRAARPLLGVAAGVGTVAPRVVGAGIESAFFAVGGVLLAVAAVEGAGWLVRNRAAVAGRVHRIRTDAELRRAERRPAA